MPAHSKQVRRVNSHQQRRAIGGFEDTTAFLRQTYSSPHQRIESRRSKRDDQIGPQVFDLGAEPPGALLHFAGGGFRMDPPLSTRRKLEVLHRVRDVADCTVDPSFFQAIIKHFASRAYKRLSSHVLSITWLFSHEHDLGLGAAFAEHGLRGVFVKVAPLTPHGLLLQFQHRPSFSMRLRESGETRTPVSSTPCGLTPFKCQIAGDLLSSRIEAPPPIPNLAARGYGTHGHHCNRKKSKHKRRCAPWR